jgi:hypothetical protein
MGDGRDGDHAGQPESGGGPPARAGGQITFAVVANDTYDALWAYCRYIPHIAWPAIALTLISWVAEAWLPPTGQLWVLALMPVRLVLEVMAASAWIQIVALGPSRARTKTFAWGRAEWACLLYSLLAGAVVVAVATVLGKVWLWLPFGTGAVVLPETQITLLAVILGVFITPVLLLIPARVLRMSARTRTFFQNRRNLLHCGQICATHLFAVSLPLLLFVELQGLAPVTFSEPALRTLSALIETPLTYAVAYIGLTSLTVMARQLGGWRRPG